MTALRVGVMGAGAIGTYVGVRLSALGAAVTLVGRPWLVARRGALEAVPLSGEAVAPGRDLRVTTEVQDLRDVDLVLVAVKSRDSESVARQLAEILPERVTVASFQNGSRNAERLRKVLPNRVVPAMVSFNVVFDDARLRQLTSGPIYVGQPAGRPCEALLALGRAFGRTEIPFQLRADMPQVMAGKLLVNLNNGVCAATGSTIAASLRSAASRRIFSLSLSEGLSILRAGGIEPARVVTFGPGLLARFLLLPDAVFLHAAKKLITIDADAKSSTLQDIERGRATEIDDLNGELVRLAERRRLPAPVNRAVLEAVRELEGQREPKFLSIAELAERVERARVAAC